MYINITCTQVAMCSMYSSLLFSILLNDSKAVLFPTFERDMHKWINRRLLLFALVRINIKLSYRNTILCYHEDGISHL
jgi:hypothetical protein